MDVASSQSGTEMVAVRLCYAYVGTMAYVRSRFSPKPTLLHDCNMYDSLMMEPRQSLPLLSGSSDSRT